MRSMKIFSIETSCDETACAIVEDGTKVLSNAIASQIDLHSLTGGVVPEVAAREHVLNILPIIDESLSTAKLSWDDIDAIAVTKGPGLVSSLIIGTQTASVISFVKNKPIIPVQHITGHIYSNWLDIDDEISFPVLALTVSGGHNDLYLIKDHYKFEMLGESIDDAAGEAFDKVARMLGLGYPGGPVISKLALNGDVTRFKLPRPYLANKSFNFSFSGLKTAVLDIIKTSSDIDDQFKADMCACFQEAVCDVLSTKLIRALEQTNVKEVHLAGGVSANKRLREVISNKLPDDVKFRYPKSLSYCTDNAAMIGAAGYFAYMINPEQYRVGNIIPSTEFKILD